MFLYKLLFNRTTRLRKLLNQSIIRKRNKMIKIMKVEGEMRGSVQDQDHQGGVKLTEEGEVGVGAERGEGVHHNVGDQGVDHQCGGETVID